LYLRKYSSTHSGSMAQGTRNVVVKQLAPINATMKNVIISPIAFELKNMHPIHNGTMH
jgi:hypothetical protein